MHGGVASPSLGPVKNRRKAPPKEEVDEEEDESRGQVSFFLPSDDFKLGLAEEVPSDEWRTNSLRGEWATSPRNKVTKRRLRARDSGIELSRQSSLGRQSSYGSTNMFGLGELASETVTAESQISLIFSAGQRITNVEKHAAQGNRYAIAIIDILEALDAPSLNSSAAAPPSSSLPADSSKTTAQVCQGNALRYICHEILPTSRDACTNWGLIDAEMSTLDRYVVVRLILAQTEVLFRLLLRILNQLYDHLSFWTDLEDFPLRTMFVLTGKNIWQKCTGSSSRRRRSSTGTQGETKSGRDRSNTFSTRRESQGIAEMVSILEELNIRYLGQLGRLKEIMLQFEELETESALLSAANVAFREIDQILGMDSIPVVPASSLKDFFSLSNPLVVGKLASFHSALDALEPRFHASIAGLEKVPRYVKYWPEICCGALASIGLVVVGFRHKEQTAVFLNRVYQSWNDFYVEHLERPLAAILDDLIFDHTLSVSDHQATLDAKQSLGRMLSDYVSDVHPEMDTFTAERIAKELDVSVLTQQYEAELKKPIQNLVSGDLVRMLLIQLQFMKTEMLVVMQALDELIKENLFNLEVLATIPAFIVSWSLYQGGKAALRAVRGSKNSRSYVFTQVRYMLRDVEQLLNLNASDLFDNDHKRKFLRGVSLGRLVLLLHQLESLLKSHEYFFDRHERKRLAEDVSELLSDQLSIDQKINCLHRMYRCYQFLMPSNRSLEALFRRYL